MAPLVAACSASREAVVEALLTCRAAPDVPEWRGTDGRAPVFSTAGLWENDGCIMGISWGYLLILGFYWRFYGYEWNLPRLTLDG